MSARNIAMPIHTLLTGTKVSVFAYNSFAQAKAKEAMKASCKLVKPSDDGLTVEAALEVAYQNAVR